MSIVAQPPQSDQPSPVYEDEDGRLFVAAPSRSTAVAAGGQGHDGTGPASPHGSRSEPRSRSGAPDPQPDRPQDATAPARPQPASAYDALLASVMRAKSAPLLSPPPGERGEAPWTIAATARSGAHRWLLEPDRWPAGPEGRRVVVLDRRGSFPAAMSGVSVATTALAHRGPLERPVTGFAGIYCIVPPRWDLEGFPDPLGRRVGQLEDGRLWVTDPHLELLTKRLGYDVEITDSWLGVRSTALFRRFSEWARDHRAAARGTSNEIRRKVAINTAIQMIFASVPGGIWRPDWLAAIQAEARCRHWAKAWQAHQQGQTVIGLTKEDEVALLLEPGQTNVAPYKIGDGPGFVSVKGTVSASEWVAGYQRRGGR